MRVVYLIGRGPATPHWTAGAQPVALAVSDWDGVHRGQVALAQRAGAQARTLGGSAVALLPWPSPPAGAASEGAPGVRLTTLEERIARLAALGCIETLLVAPAPTESLSGPAALAWLRQSGDVRALLGDANGADADETLRHVWPAELAALAQAEGVAVEQGPWGADEAAAIRALLRAGRMREATRALGYPYSVTGEVVGGDRRGRTLGFPTANLRLEPAKLAPPNGIYAGWARLPGDTARWPAAISIGVRPTFGEGLRQQIEAHLIEATMDLYGVQLQVEFVEYLREELRFAGFEALIEQMERDREHARELLEAESSASSLSNLTNLTDSSGA